MPAQRLTHTNNAAFRRYMQLSSAKAFLFVEGKTDRYVYSKISDSVLSGKDIPFQICLAQELPQNTGGKRSLLRFFNYLKRHNALIDDFKGTQKGSIFYLDKDVDDMCRRIKKSQHVVYTRHYSIENYFFSEGDLIHAVAAVALLTLSDVRHRFRRANKDWQRSVAQNWKEWVKLCVFCSKRKIKYDCNYSVYSQVNNGPYTPLDAASYASRLAELERRSMLTSRGFKLSFGSVSRYIDKIYDDDNFDLVFKGKWYLPFLAHDASRIAGGIQIAQSELLKALQVTLNPNGVWADDFKNPLKILIAQIG